MSNYEPKNSTKFFDRATGREMLWDQDTDWLYFRHPDGQWVSQRQATEDDKQKINALLQGYSVEGFFTGMGAVTAPSKIRLNPSKIRKVDFPCDCCGITRYPIVMLKHDLWMIVNSGTIRGKLCPDCIEKRLGRPLVWEDLLPCPLTEELKLGYRIGVNSNAQRFLS